MTLLYKTHWSVTTDVKHKNTCVIIHNVHLLRRPISSLVLPGMSSLFSVGHCELDHRGLHEPQPLWPRAMSLVVRSHQLSTPCPRLSSLVSYQAIFVVDWVLANIIWAISPKNDQPHVAHAAIVVGKHHHLSSSPTELNNSHLREGSGSV